LQHTASNQHQLNNRILSKTKQLIHPSLHLHTLSQATHTSYYPALSLAVVQVIKQRPKRQKINRSQELCHRCIGRESNPGLADIRLLRKKHQMATANFTTKPPMLDENC
jgi:hypothetical protein